MKLLNTWNRLTTNEILSSQRHSFQLACLRQKRNKTNENKIVKLKIIAIYFNWSFMKRKKLNKLLLCIHQNWAEFSMFKHFQWKCFSVIKYEMWKVETTNNRHINHFNECENMRKIIINMMHLLQVIGMK